MASKKYWTEPQNSDGTSGGYMKHDTLREARVDAKACLELYPVVYIWPGDDDEPHTHLNYIERHPKNS